MVWVLIHIIIGFIFLYINMYFNLISTSNYIGHIVDWTIMLITVILFFLSIINLNNNRKISKQIHKYNNTNNINDVTNRLLQSLISNSFKRGISDDIDSVFSYENIHKLTMNGLQPIISNTMTALGVLGTFIGLIIGLGNLGNTTNEIVAGIDGLIPGIKTAFTTSIIGLSLSTSYNFCFKNLQIQLHDNINQLKSAFSTIDIGAPEDLDGLTSVLNQFCAKSIELVRSIENRANAAEEKIANAERHLADQLSNFESITTQKLQEYFETTNNINNKHIESLLTAFEVGQHKIAETIKAAHDEEMVKLVKLYQDNSERLLDLFDINHSELEKWLGLIAEQQEIFRENQQNIEKQQELLNQKQQAINSNLDRMVTSEENILSSMVNISDNIDRTYDKITDAYSELDKAADKVKESDEKLVNTVDILKTAINNLSDNTSGLKDVLNESTEVVKNNLTSISNTMNKSVETCSSLSNTIEKQIDVVDRTNGQIKENNDTLARYIYNLDRNTSKTKDNIDILDKSMHDNISKLNDDMSNLIKQTGDRIEQMADTKTKQVSADIEKIVEQEAKSIEEISKLMQSLGKGLLDYSSKMMEGKLTSEKALENIELSRTNSEILNKDLISIHNYLERIAVTVEKLKGEDEKVDETF